MELVPDLEDINLGDKGPFITSKIWLLQLNLK